MAFDITTGVDTEKARTEFVTMKSKEGGYLDLANSHWKLGNMDTILGAGGDWLAKKVSQWENGDREQFSAETLNQAIATENGFDESMDIETALIVADRYAQKQELMAKIAKGPEGVIAAGVSFAAGMAAHMTDPVEVGLSIVTGNMLGGVMAAGKMGTTAMAVGKLMRTNSFLGTVLNDVVGNMVVEPIIAGAMTGLDEDYTVADFALSTLAAPIAMAGIRFGGKRAFRYMKTRGTLAKQLPAEVGSALSGKTPDMEPMADAVARETELYRGVIEPQEPNKAYVVSKDGDLNTHLDPDASRYELSGDKAAAHAEAGSAFREGGNGHVHELDTNKLKVLDAKADAEADPAVKDLLDAMRESRGETAKKGDTLSDFIDDTMSQTDEYAAMNMEILEDELMRLGYDGWSSKEGISLLTTKNVGEAMDAAAHGTKIDTLPEATKNMEEFLSKKKAEAEAGGEEYGTMEDTVAAVRDTPTELQDVEPPRDPKDVSPESVAAAEKPVREMELREEASLGTLRTLADDGTIKADKLDEFVDLVDDLRLEAEETTSVFEAAIACMRG